MKQYYLDILSRIAEPPAWYDENGTPRYGEHHPKLAPSIYAKEVVLMEIACQECLRRFLVQLNWSTMDEIVHKIPTLSEQVTTGVIHYGDPPRHGDKPLGDEGRCAAGDTMNCYDLRIVEFWLRELMKDWRRESSLEIELNDLKDLTKEEAWRT